MNRVKESFFYKFLNKLDISEDSYLTRLFTESFLLGLINKFFQSAQGLFSRITSNSLLINNIDCLIIGLITILLISLTFCATATIGLIAGITFILFLIKLTLKKNEQFSINALDVPIFAYIGLIVLSAAFSTLFIPSIKGLAKVIVYFASYLVFFNILKDKPLRSYYFLAIIAFTAFGESVLAIYQNFVGVESLATWQDAKNVNPELLMTRVYGSLKPYNPNLLAGYLTAAISSTAGLFFLFACKKKFRLTLVFLVAFISIFLAIIFTGSRGAYLGAGGILAALTLISGHIIWHDFPKKIWLRKIWIYLTLIGISGVLFLILASPSLQHRIASIFAFWEDSSNSFRFNVYMSSLQMFLDNWLTGIGPGNEVFRLVYGLYMKTGFDALAAYSVPLEIAVESGIFALLAFLWILLIIFLKTAKILLNSNNIEKKILVSCCMIAIMGIIIHGLVDTIFFRPQVQLLFWMFIAVFAVNAKN